MCEPVYIICIIQYNAQRLNPLKTVKPKASRYGHSTSTIITPEKNVTLFLGVEHQDLMIYPI